MSTGMELDAIVNRTPYDPDRRWTPAAVLIPVLADHDPTELLFTRRAPDLDTHPGQMSFPGGRMESTDADLYETALRETFEEIGLDPTEIDVHGRLDPIVTVTGFEVTPVVGEIPIREFEPNPTEVDEIITVPIPTLLDERNYVAERRDHPERGAIVVHYFNVGENTVWGATARILVQLLELTHGWEPPADPST